MGSKYKLVLWDVDGTLLDTSEGIISAAKYTIERYDMKMPSDDVLKSFIGPPLKRSFMSTFAVEEERAMEMVNVFRSRYKELDLLKAKPYEGIIPLIRDISSISIKQGIATNKRQDLAEILLRSFGFSGYMDVICGSDVAGKLTKSDIIHKATQESGVTSLDEIVMIGDSDGDQKGAAKLGCDFIAVTYGFGFVKSKVEGIEKLADNANEIRNLLGI